MSKEIATLGGGCFWCLEAVFNQMQGVESAISGYCGGATENPTYKEVCSGDSGHAEAVQITFDPALLSFRALLEVFFTIHDPTTLNRQGNDVGSQYRSAIFYHSREQQAEAEKMVAELAAAHVWPDPIVTEIVPLDKFYPAEGYHQEYFKLHGEQPYCRVVVAPKVAKFREKFGAKLKQG